MLRQIILWKLFTCLIWLTLFMTCSVTFACHWIHRDSHMKYRSTACLVVRWIRYLDNRNLDPHCMQMCQKYRDQMVKFSMELQESCKLKRLFFGNKIRFEIYIFLPLAILKKGGPLPWYQTEFLITENQSISFTTGINESCFQNIQSCKYELTCWWICWSSVLTIWN